MPAGRRRGPAMWAPQLTFVAAELNAGGPRLRVARGARA